MRMAGGGGVLLSLANGLRRGLGRIGWRQFDPGAARLGKADRNRLLGGAGAVLALANMFDFLANEFAGLSRGRFSRWGIAFCSSQGAFFRHVNYLCNCSSDQDSGKPISDRFRSQETGCALQETGCRSTSPVE